MKILRSHPSHLTRLSWLQRGNRSFRRMVCFLCFAIDDRSWSTEVYSLTFSRWDILKSRLRLRTRRQGRNAGQSENLAILIRKDWGIVVFWLATI